MGCSPCSTESSVNGQAAGSGAPATPNLMQVLDRVVNDVVIANTNATTTLYTFTVPANTVTIEGQVLRLRIRGDMFCGIAGAPSFTLRAQFGGLLWYADAAAGRTNNPVAIPWRIDLEIARKSAALFYGSMSYDAMNATAGATTGGGDLLQVGTVSSPTSPLDSLGSRACDFTIAQVLTISITLAVADANYLTTMRSGTLVLE